MSDLDLRERTLQYLATHNVATLASASAEGPWASPVFYANDGFTLYFVSDPGTRHGTAVGGGACIGAAITEDHRDWTTIQGIQLTGICRPVDESERPRATVVYLAKFPFAAGFLDPAGPMYARTGAKVVFYALQADSLWFTDNRYGFGHREHLALK